MSYKSVFFASSALGITNSVGGRSETLPKRTLLEPAMFLVMGGVVLLIVLAILLPIIEMNQMVC